MTKRSNKKASNPKRQPTGLEVRAFEAGYMQGVTDNTERWIYFLELLRQEIGMDNETFKNHFEQAYAKVSKGYKQSVEADVGSDSSHGKVPDTTK